MTKIPIDRRALLAGAGGLAATLAMPQASRAATGPISFVVPFAAGGSLAALVRILAVAVSPLLGTQVLVDNKPGASSIIGASYVAKARPDGRTYLIGSNSSLVYNIAMFETLAYDPVRDFVPVIKFAEVPMLIIGRPDLPYKTLSELVAYAKAKPGKINRSSSGVSNVSNVGFLKLEQLAGIETLQVPFAAETQSMTALFSGTVDIHVGSGSIMRQIIREGRLRGFAVMGPSRLPDVPDVPTLAELGYQGADASAWFVLAAPAGTPPADVAQVNDAFNKALRDPKTLERIRATGQGPSTGTPDDAARFLQAERATWIPILKAAGIRG